MFNGQNQRVEPGAGLGCRGTTSARAVATKNARRRRLLSVRDQRLSSTKRTFEICRRQRFVPISSRYTRHRRAGVSAVPGRVREQRLRRAPRKGETRQEEKVEEIEAQEGEEIAQGEQVQLLHRGRLDGRAARRGDRPPRPAGGQQRRGTVRESTATASRRPGALRGQRGIRPGVALPDEVVHSRPGARRRVHGPGGRSSVREPHRRAPAAGRLRHQRPAVGVQRQRTVRTSPARQQRQEGQQVRPQDAQQKLHHAPERGLPTTPVELALCCCRRTSTPTHFRISPRYI